MAAVHEIADVKRAIRKMVVIWAASTNIQVGYLAGVALEANILDLIEALSHPQEDLEAGEAELPNA